MIAVRTLPFRVLLAAAAALPAPAAAQRFTAERLFVPGTVSLSAQLGGVAFTDFRRTEARLEPAVAGAQMERRISAQTSLSFGAGAGVWLGRAWGVRVEGTYAPTRFDVQVADESGAGRTRQLEGGGLHIWTAEAHLLFRLPFRLDRLVPYGVLGGGAAIYDPRGDTEAIPYEAREDFARGARTRGAGVVGLGAVLPLERYGLLLRFELSDLVTRTPVGSGEPGTFRAEDGQATVAESDRGGSVTSHVRFTIGLTKPLR